MAAWQFVGHARGKIITLLIDNAKPNKIPVSNPSKSFTIYTRFDRKLRVFHQFPLNQIPNFALLYSKIINSTLNILTSTLLNPPTLTLLKIHTFTLLKIHTSSLLKFSNVHGKLKTLVKCICILITNLLLIWILILTQTYQLVSLRMVRASSLCSSGTNSS